MATVKYVIDPARSKVVVCARSSIHDTNAEWTKITGEIEADPTALSSSPSTARIVVDMTQFDAGDFLRNRKLKKDLDVKHHPEARFDLAQLANVVETEAKNIEASAQGTLTWHGHTVELKATGAGRVDADSIDATAEFELDVRDVGVEPPRFLMLKVEEIVAVKVTLRATAKSPA